MADWTALPNAAVGIGGIPSGTTVTALRDNPIAIAERAAGAPKPIDDYEFLSRAVISGTPAVIDFTFDQTLYDAIVFKFANVIPASDNVSLNIRFSSDSGATFLSGATDYAFSNSIVVSSGVTSTSLGGDASEAFISVCSAIGSASGEDGFSGQITAYGPSINSRQLLSFWGNFWGSDATNRNVTGGGSSRGDLILNAMRFYFSSGNLESGTITMFGVRNS